MDIVDLSVSARSGGDAEWVDGADGWLARRGVFLRRLTPGQMSAGLLIVGFVLVMVSQWLPWIRVAHEPGISDTFDPAEVRKTSNLVDSGGFLLIPYYVLWLVVFMAGGALVFLSGSRQRVAFGAATGALATQLLLIVPVLQSPIDHLVNVGPDTRHIQIVHTSGSYLIIVAFVVLAASFIVAVGGRIFPAAADARPNRPAERGQPDRSGRHAAGSMHDAFAHSVPGHDEDADIEIGWSPNRIEVRSEEAPTEDVVGPASKDHSMYQRPVRNDEAPTATGR